jgi:DNA-directed RNA polymerase subunit K/omega
MGFIPVEKLTDNVTNKYEAVLIAAKDARIQNSIAGLQELDPNEARSKMTTLSLQRVIDHKINYFYGEEKEIELESGDDLLDIDDANSKTEDE